MCIYSYDQYIYIYTYINPGIAMFDIFLASLPTPICQGLSGLEGQQNPVDARVAYETI